MNDAVGARAFCNSPSFTTTRCGWASEEEIAKTTSNQCPFCGTVWWGQATPPQIVTAHDTYFQLAGRQASLACRGRVVARAVLKLIDSENRLGGPLPAKCAPARLDSESYGLPRGSLVPHGLVTRCALELPNGPSGNETARAAAATSEVNCSVCRPCDDAVACPGMRVGQWYSDSFATVLEGCEALKSTSRG